MQLFVRSVLSQVGALQSTRDRLTTDPGPTLHNTGPDGLNLFLKKKIAGVLLCHLSREKQIRSLRVVILHKRKGFQTQKLTDDT